MAFPLLLHLRQLTVWVGLINKFEKRFSTETPPDVAVKEVFKTLLNPRICDAVKRTFDQNGLMINIIFEVKDEIKELEKLTEVKPELFSKYQSRQYRNEFITRNSFEKNLIPAKIQMNKFSELIKLPSEFPENVIELNKIFLTGPTVFYAGRYCKFSRNLSQTPWVLNGRLVMDDSVSDLIIDQVVDYFGVAKDSIIFSSSGREDVDVRCLGRGRPFVLEIPNSMKTKISSETAGKMEEMILKSDKVSVRDLQMVSREDLVHIKTGEEKKKKIYRAMCKLDEPITDDMLTKLEMPGGFQIEQITPIRVLHRRPLHARPRTVFSVKPFSHPTDKDLIILDIVTQAGTYIKELVHSDFGRTTPSLSSILGKSMDIVALDVMAIDLDWPPEIIR